MGFTNEPRLAGDALKILNYLLSHPGWDAGWDDFMRRSDEEGWPNSELANPRNSKAQYEAQRRGTTVAARVLDIFGGQYGSYTDKWAWILTQPEAPAAPPGTPPGSPSAPGPIAIGNGLSSSLSELAAWAKANPLPAAGIAFIAIYLLRR